MEDGVKEDPAQNKEPKFLGKAGWLKKAPGRLLASYKDRYIHVEKTEVVVYDNEDLQNCLERLDLENYDTCHELKSPFKKKHRLILLRSPKSGNKVHDVKFQAQTVEEKEAWIKALSDGINRVKNKVFDEVKVDESNNLEHVTRTRPKGNRNRRPPTRIHMKEVAVMSSDGILRLDLDLQDAVMPNGTHHANVDGTESLKEAVTVSAPQSNTSEAAEKQLVLSAEEEVQGKFSPQKKVIKPPMPPSKEAKSSSAPEDEPDKDDDPEKKVLKPPMPPSKEAKPCASPVEEITELAKPDEVPEICSDARKKTGPPPTPPNKPSSNSSMNSLAEASQSRPNSHLPTPPPKENKPSPPAVEPVQQVQDTSDENTEKEENSKKEINGETDEEESIPEEALTHVRDDKPESPTTEGKVSEEESGETISSGMKRASGNDPEVPTEPLRKSCSPLPTPKKKPVKPVQPETSHMENCSVITLPSEGRDSNASDNSASSLQVEDALPKCDIPSVVVSLNDPPSDSLSLSPLLCHLSMDKKKKAEEKSVDSGQHSDDDSEGSGSEDTLAVSTAALRGSHAGLDVLDASEDDTHMSVISKPALVATKPQVSTKVFPCRRLEPASSLKPAIKARSASFGDLLSDSAVCIQVKQPSRVGAGTAGASNDDVLKLETEVALEMEKTSKLLNRVSQAQGRDDGEGMPENLLAKAMEKLKKADHVLREVKKLKFVNSSSNRKSW